MTTSPPVGLLPKAMDSFYGGLAFLGREMHTGWVCRVDLHKVSRFRVSPPESLGAQMQRPGSCY